MAEHHDCRGAKLVIVAAPAHRRAQPLVEDLPVLDSVLIVRRDWLGAHQEEVYDLLRNLVETHRRIAAGPEWAVARTLRLFPEEDAAFVEAVVRAHIALPGEVSQNPDDYADLRPLEDVLKKVGKK